MWALSCGESLRVLQQKPDIRERAALEGRFGICLRMGGNFGDSSGGGEEQKRVWDH